MTATRADEAIELGNFQKPHRVWKAVSVLSLAIGAALIAVGSSWNQLTAALWYVVAFCAVFAAAMWALTWVMQRSLRIEERGLVRASALRERVLPWSQIGRARVGKSEVGQYFPQLIIEGADGRLAVAYGRGLINRPLEEAAELINAELRRLSDLTAN